MAKLTEDQVFEILDRMNRGESARDICGEYDVARVTLSLIANGRNWPHIDRSPYPNLLDPDKAAQARNDARFWKRVKFSPRCWEWLGHKNRKGYGQQWMGRKLVSAHRYSYAQFYGEIPTGMQVDHTCRNRGCVNPDHLRLVTNKQNQENVGLRKDSKSGYRGVTWHVQHQKWAARVGHNGKRIHIGYFDTPEEANEAAIEKRRELYTHNNEEFSG